MNEFTTWLQNNMGLLVHMADYRYKGGSKFPVHFSIDDLIQEAKIAVFKAWNNYDEERGHFTPCAITYISNRFSRFDRSYKNRGKTQELTTVVGEDYTFYQQPKKDFSTLYSTLYRGIKEQLNNEQYDILCRYYGLFDFSEETYEEIGKDYDLTKQRIAQKVNDAEEVLRKWMEDHGYSCEVLGWK